LLTFIQKRGKFLKIMSQVLSTFPTNLHRTIHPGAKAFEGGTCYLVSMKRLPFSQVDQIGKKHLAVLPEVTTPLVQDPFDSKNTKKIGTDGTLHFGVDPRPLNNYKEGLQYLQEKVLQNPQSFFDQDLEKIQEVFLAFHQIIMKDAPECCPGELRKDNFIVFSEGLSAFFQKEDQKKGKNKKPLHVNLATEVCKNLQELGKKVLQKEISPMDAAAQIHCEIHKTQFFDAGSGRFARGWMNVMLQLGGIQAVSFTILKSYHTASDEGNDSFKKLINRMSQVRVFD
jgi:hypothetical protein